MTRGALDPHVRFPSFVSLGMQVMTKDGRNELSVCKDLPLPYAKATTGDIYIVAHDQAWSSDAQQLEDEDNEALTLP